MLLCNVLIRSLSFHAHVYRVYSPVIWNFVLLGMRSSSCRGNSCFLPRRRPLDHDCYFRWCLLACFAKAQTVSRTSLQLWISGSVVSHWKTNTDEIDMASSYRFDETFFSFFLYLSFIYIERSGWKEYYLVVYSSNLVKFRSIDNYYSNETLPFQKRCLSRDDIYSWYKSWSLRHIFLFFDIKLHHHEALFAFYESPSGIFLFRQKTPSWLRCSLANHSKISCYPPFATKCRYVSLIRRICKETFIEKSDDWKIVQPETSKIRRRDVDKFLNLADNSFRSYFGCSKFQQNYVS